MLRASRISLGIVVWPFRVSVECNIRVPYQYYIPYIVIFPCVRWNGKENCGCGGSMNRMGDRWRAFIVVLIGFLAGCSHSDAPKPAPAMAAVAPTPLKAVDASDGKLRIIVFGAH